MDLNCNSMGECHDGDQPLAEPPRDHPLWRQWERLSALTTSRFRFYIYSDRVWLETEFCYFTDVPEEEAKVQAFITAVGGETSVMDEGLTQDQWKNLGDTEWRQGPDHGRPYRQVDVTLDVTTATPLMVDITMTHWRDRANETGAAEFWVDVL